VQGDAIETVTDSATRWQLEFLAELLRDYLESYLVAVRTLKELSGPDALDKKAFIKAALETGRADFATGKIATAESLSRTNYENALAYLIDQGFLAEQGKSLVLGPLGRNERAREALAESIRPYLG
jgi:glycerol-3-phosphate O-acyltransferase